MFAKNIYLIYALDFHKKIYISLYKKYIFYIYKIYLAILPDPAICLFDRSNMEITCTIFFVSSNQQLVLQNLLNMNYLPLCASKSISVNFHPARCHRVLLELG